MPVSNRFFSAARRLLGSVLCAVATIALPARSVAESAPPTPLNIEITLTSGSPTPGRPISVSWKLVNSSHVELIGSLVYYLNDQPLGALPQPGNSTSVLPGKLLSGTQSFDPVPGINVFSIVLLNVNAAAIGNHNPPKLTEIENGKMPSPTGPAGVSPIPVTISAEGSLRVNASPPVASLANGLSSANRQQLMKDYAPLFLYSFDHGSDEEYAPISVVPFLSGSTLESSLPNGNLTNATLQSTPLAILNPVPSAASPAGTITAMQAALPAELYVTPLPNSVQKGTAWATVMSSQNPNVGLYGHVTLLDLQHFQSDADTNLPAQFAERYGCTPQASCSAQIIKIEYWQFFGYSHDYQGTLDSDIDSDTDHSGDWCTVQVYVDASWWQSPQPGKAILAVYHYLHGIQVGFDMAQVSAAPTAVTVPTRPSNESGNTYMAEEYHGPNFGESVEFSIKAKGIWFPIGGPDMTTEKAHAQNNTVQLAAEDVSRVIVGGPLGSGEAPHPVPVLMSYQHPVVYVEWGGHEFWPTPGWSIYGASKHDGTGQYSYFGSLPVDLTFDRDPLHPLVNAPPDVRLVTSFAGYWGAKGGGGPPQGPPLHLQWYWNPDTTTPDLLQKIESSATTRTY
jgi:hypothetical protein